MESPFTPAPAVVTAPPPSAPPVTVVPEKGGGFGAGVKRIFSFIAWVLSGFGLIHAFRRRQTGATRAEEIVVYTVHRSFYVWSLILIGFVGSFCVRHFGHPTGWGWIYVLVLLYTFAAMMFDVSTFKALL